MLSSDYDVLSVVGLDCPVARIASRCWHSYLKNAFLLLADADLMQWMADQGAMAEFERSVRDVCEGLQGYSPSRLVSLLSPLASLPDRESDRLREQLDRVFEAGFRPALVALEIEQALAALLGAIGRTDAARGDGKDGVATGEVRRHASALRSVLENLPAGFWLPRTIEDVSL
jgi:hypothetical protein